MENTDNIVIDENEPMELDPCYYVIITSEFIDGEWYRFAACCNHLVETL